MSEPRYGRVGFLLDVYEPWANYVRTWHNDEWGGFVSSLWSAARAASSLGDQSGQEKLLRMFKEELDLAFANNFWDTLEEGQDQEIAEVQSRYAEIEKHWLDRAAWFSSRDLRAMKHAAATLPEWVKP